MNELQESQACEQHHRMSRAAVAAALTIALPVGHHAALAAEPAPASATGKPPRIGLALSGGGARGIAHVGVLKVLEEMRIPIHCVTGTSMGSIVGGTFAAGTPPARLEELVLTADWAEIFRDQPPRDKISMRRKIDDFKTLFAPEFGVKDGGLALPKGVIAGVWIESFFRVLAEPAMNVSDFGSCPSRFGRWRPTSRPASRWCSTAAASRRRCARACRCRGRSPRSKLTVACWSTAALPTTCRSTRRANSAPT